MFAKQFSEFLLKNKIVENKDFHISIQIYIFGDINN